MRSELTVTIFECDSCLKRAEVEGSQTAAPAGWAFVAFGIGEHGDEARKPAGNDVALVCSAPCARSSLDAKVEAWGDRFTAVEAVLP